MVRKRKELGINLDIYTVHGKARKRKFSARQKKWETMGSIKALESLCHSIMESSKGSGKVTFTLPEVVCIFRISLGCHHEMLSKITGKKAQYTLDDAIAALKHDTGVDVTDSSDLRILKGLYND